MGRGRATSKPLLDFSLLEKAGSHLGCTLGSLTNIHSSIQVVELDALALFPFAPPPTPMPMLFSACSCCWLVFPNRGVLLLCPDKL